jgi:hypothetical protein
MFSIIRKFPDFAACCEALLARVLEKPAKWNHRQETALDADVASLP